MFHKFFLCSRFQLKAFGTHCHLPFCCVTFLQGVDNMSSTGNTPGSTFERDVRLIGSLVRGVRRSTPGVSRRSDTPKPLRRSGGEMWTVGMLTAERLRDESLCAGADCVAFGNFVVERQNAVEIFFNGFSHSVEIDAGGDALGCIVPRNDLPVPLGVACVLDYGKVPVPVTKVASASSESREDIPVVLVPSTVSESILCDAASVAQYTVEEVIEELQCDPEPRQMLAQDSVSLLALDVNPVACGVPCELAPGGVVKPVAPAASVVTSGCKVNAATWLVSNLPSEDVLRDALPDEDVCCEASEVFLEELFCDEEEVDMRSPCTFELPSVGVPLLEKLPEAEGSVEEAVVEETGEAASEKTDSTMVSDRTALSYLLDGVWSVDTYEEWAVKYYKRATAPYCDFKRYSKCVALDVSLNVVAQHEAKICKTPVYKKRVKKNTGPRSGLLRQRKGL